MIEQRPSPSQRPSADRDLQPPALVDAGFTVAFSLGVLITCVSATLTGFVLFLAPLGYWLPAGIVTAGLGGLTFAFSRAESGRRWAVWTVAAFCGAMALALTALAVVLAISAHRWGGEMAATGNPAAALLLAAAALDVCFIVSLLRWEGRVRRAEKRMREQCVACGYDLRGNLEATTCPECGAVLCEPGA